MGIPVMTAHGVSCAPAWLMLAPALSHGAQGTGRARRVATFPSDSCRGDLNAERQGCRGPPAISRSRPFVFIYSSHSDIQFGQCMLQPVCLPLEDYSLRPPFLDSVFVPGLPTAVQEYLFLNSLLVAGWRSPPAPNNCGSLRDANYLQPAWRRQLPPVSVEL